MLLYGFAVFVSLFISVKALSLNNGDSAKIAGGQATAIEAVPYQVALYRYGTYVSECGAVIIHESAVLTAAHCVQGLQVDDVTFSAGSSSNNRSGTLHRADWIVVHYDYDWTTLANDIAFVKVVEPFVWSTQVKAVALPTAAPPATGTALVSGWGPRQIGGSPLMSVSIPLIDLATCQTKFSKYDLQPSGGALCAGPGPSGAGPCDGDAGGPLVVQGVLLGVFSWGAPCPNTQYPSVFANVFTFKQFIDENISYIRPR